MQDLILHERLIDWITKKPSETFVVDLCY